jgi:hypothetical protein
MIANRPSRYWEWLSVEHATSAASRLYRLVLLEELALAHVIPGWLGWRGLCGGPLYLQPRWIAFAPRVHQLLMLNDHVYEVGVPPERSKRNE